MQTLSLKLFIFGTASTAGALGAGEAEPHVAAEEGCLAGWAPWLLPSVR